MIRAVIRVAWIDEREYVYLYVYLISKNLKRDAIRRMLYTRDPRSDSLSKQRCRGHRVNSTVAELNVCRAASAPAIKRSAERERYRCDRIIERKAASNAAKRATTEFLASYRANQAPNFVNASSEVQAFGWSDTHIYGSARHRCSSYQRKLIWCAPP